MAKKKRPSRAKLAVKLSRDEWEDTVKVLDNLTWVANGWALMLMNEADEELDSDPDEAENLAYEAKETSRERNKALEFIKEIEKQTGVEW